MQGLTGFAYGLIVVPALALLLTLPEAVGLAVLPGGAVVAYGFFLHRRRVEYRQMLRFALVGLLPLPLGALFLYSLPEQVITGVLGAVVVILTLWSLTMVEHSQRALARPGIGYVFAVLSGLLGGAFTTPGPAMVTYLYASDLDRMRAKANVQFFFLLLFFGILATHIGAGTVDGKVALRSLPFLPLVIGGVYGGTWLSGRVDARRFRAVTDAALIMMGVYLMLNAVIAGA